MRALRAVGAVLGAAAGLDRQQGAQLHARGVVMSPVRHLGAEDQLRQRQIVDGADLLVAPVVADGSDGAPWAGPGEPVDGSRRGRGGWLPRGGGGSGGG